MTKCLFLIFNVIMFDFIRLKVKSCSLHNLLNVGNVYIFPNMTMLAGLTKDKYIVVHIYIHHAEFWVTVFGLCCFFKLYVKFDLMFPFLLLVGLKLAIITIACPLTFFQNHAHAYNMFCNNNKRGKKNNPKTLRFSWQIETFYGCGFVLRWSYVTDGTLKSKN